MFADRYRIAHQDRYGVTHQLFIMEDDFVGSVTELTASGDFFSVTYAVDDERNFWAGQIIDTRISAQVEVTTVGVRNFFQNIINQPLGKYRLRYQKNEAVRVFATLRNDVVDIEDRGFPITVKFEGSTFAKEKADEVLLSGDRTIIKAIADFTEFDVPIISLNNIFSTGFADTNDFLGTATVDTSRLQQYPDGQQGIQLISKFDSLKELLPHGFFLIHRAGAYYVYQLSEIIQKEGLDMRAFYYDSSGDLIASLPALSIRQEVDYNLTPESLVRNYGGIKRAEYKYNHGTLQKVVPFPPTFSVNVATFTREFEISVRDVIGGKIYFSGEIRNFLDNDNAGVSNVEFTIQAGQRYWNGNKWTSSSADRLSIVLFGSSSGIGGGDDIHNRSFSIVTDEIPGHADPEDLKIICRVGTTALSGTNVEVTQYTNMEAILAQDGIGEAVQYRVDQEGDFPVMLELPDKRFGQGPNAFSPGAYGAGGSDPVYLPDETSLDARDLGVLVLEEIIATQQKGIRVFKPTTITDADFGRMIRFRNNWLLILGGTYKVRDGVISNGFLLSGVREVPPFDSVIEPFGPFVRIPPPGVSSSVEEKAFTSDGHIRNTMEVEDGGGDGTLSKRIRALDDEGNISEKMQIKPGGEFTNEDESYRLDDNGLTLKSDLTTPVEPDTAINWVDDLDNPTQEFMKIYGLNAQLVGGVVEFLGDFFLVKSGDNLTDAILRYGLSGGTLTVNATLIAEGSLRFNHNLITPITALPSFSVAQNNYAIGSGKIFTIQATGVASETSITGIFGGGLTDGRQITFINRGTDGISLEHEDTASDAENRIIGPGNNFYSIPQNGAVELIYDGTAQRWRIISTS